MNEMKLALRSNREKSVNPSFDQLMDGVKEQLKKLRYPQAQNLVGPTEVLREWCRGTRWEVRPKRNSVIEK